MKLLLPPSETKRDGGGNAALNFDALSFPSLNTVRRRLVRATVALARDAELSRKALKLGPKGDEEITRNRHLKTSPTMPAIERYTGVLYDGLEVLALSAQERQRANERVLIHSALFGIIAANDHIPAYRLSHDSRLPGVSMKQEWSEQNAQVLSGLNDLVVDLRSEGYVQLGPAPGNSPYVRVVAPGPDGHVRALNHFNKKAKGEFTRSLLSVDADIRTVSDLLDAARSLGWTIESGHEGELLLVVSGGR